jgi:hypothetical protein
MRALVRSNSPPSLVASRIQFHPQTTSIWTVCNELVCARAGYDYGSIRALVEAQMTGNL